MTMPGLMMDSQLTINSIMNYAEQTFADVEIVSVTHDNPRHRYTYKAAFSRAKQLANALAQYDLPQGTRIGTLAWNDHRHFEIYYGVSCSGLVCHTINPRLFPEQIHYIIEHGQDQILFVDPLFVPLIEALDAKLTQVKQYVLMTDDAHMPESQLPNICSYEAFINGHAATFDFPELEENAASSLCYTSGTTGDPKGVLYSHRSTVLHSMASLLPNAMAVSSDDVIMPIVPMFHVNAWGIPYSAALCGCKLVFPGPKMADGATIVDLVNSEKVSFSVGVPTIWQGLIQYLDATESKIPSLKRCIVGGAATPLSLIKQFSAYGITLQTGWGMTETSPIGTINVLKPALQSLNETDKDRIAIKQGLTVFGVELRIVDDENNELARDGKAFGKLQIRGGWVCQQYYGLNESALTADGWFDTGDIATIDANGYMEITDRAKDVIKSGGEWISSMDLENAAVEHEQIKQAAVIGLPHQKWDERPLLVVSLNGESLDKDSVIALLTTKVAKWWLPDDIVIVDELPLTATGKLDKKVLRVQFADHQWPA